MDFTEYQGKQLLGRFGLRIPEGQLARHPMDAMTAAAALGRCVVKAQITQGGRGKAGLVRFADNAEEAGRAAADLLSLQDIHDVDLLLIERRIDIRRELYLAIKVDDVSGAPLVIASAQGGMHVEGQAHSLQLLAVDVLKGLRRHDALDLWKRVGLAGRQLQESVEATVALWRAFQHADATLLEVNPLVFDADDRCWAVDAKLSVDDNALYRHPEWADQLAERKGTALERRAARLGVNCFIEMDGDIAIISTGASFGMLLLDSIFALGGRPANFMDMGGQSTGFSREKIVELVAAHAGSGRSIRAILIAMIQTSKPLRMTVDAITNAFRNRPAPCPVFCWIGAAHLATREQPLEVSLAQLEQSGIKAYADLQQALQAAVEAARQ